MLKLKDQVEKDNKNMQLVEKFRDYYNTLDTKAKENHLEALNNFIDKDVESERIREFMKEVALIVYENAEELGLKKIDNLNEESSIEIIIAEMPDCFKEIGLKPRNKGDKYVILRNSLYCKD